MTTIFRPATREIVSHDFAFGDAAQAIFTMPAAGRVIEASVTIRTAFTDAAATIKVGPAADDDGVIATTDNVPTTEGEYQVRPDFDLSSGDAIRLTISPGSSVAGSGVITLVISFD